MQEYIGWPITQAFKSYINNNLILYCYTTSDDIDRAISIYGAPRHLLQGKMVWKGATTSQEHVRVFLPPQISENYVNVQLYIDFFCVNKTPFLHTNSGQINFLTVQPCTSKVNQIIISGINNVKKIYRSRGFLIVFFRGDKEFNINLLKHKCYLSIWTSAPKMNIST